MIVNTPKELANYIKSHRKSKKISQATIADFAGIKQTTVSAFELQNSNISLDTLYRILAATELEIDIRPRQKSEAHPNISNWHEEW